MTLKPYAKIIYVFGFLSICRSAISPVLPVMPFRQFCQSGSFARASVCQSASLPESFCQFFPECQFRQSASFGSNARAPEFARAPVLPVMLERQFCQCAKAPECQSVLPECQFCQSASRQFASGKEFAEKNISYTELYQTQGFIWSFQHQLI